MMRTILHMDLDSFFVSVELLKNPSLRGKPVIVGGTSQRGVVTSASYEARRMGVRSAMPSYRVRQLCPDAIFLKGDFKAYAYYSQLVRELVRGQVPVLQVASIDEFYADLSGMDRYAGGAWPFAQQLRQYIMQHTGLPISMGMATTRNLAKMATNEAKPNGELWVQPGTERQWLAPLAVEKIPMVGKRGVQALQRMGVFTIGQLQAYTEAQLEARFGKFGPSLWRKANGCDRSLVTDEPWVRKSLGHERTFGTNMTDLASLRRVMTRLAEKCGHELRTKGWEAGCLTVKLKYADFRVQSHQQRIAPTHSDRELIHTAHRLLQQLYATGQPVRLAGVRLSEFSIGGQQGNLFANNEKENKLHQALDAIKLKHGERSLARASGWVPGRDKDREIETAAEEDED